MNIEEARRRVLNAPDDFLYTADDYLDQLAEEYLAEIRAKVEAAPTMLARHLLEQGKTRGELAEALNVSASAVGHWASGERPLPAARADEVASYLGVPRWSVTRAAQRGTSYFGWTLENIVLMGAGAPARGQVATSLGVTLAHLNEWAAGTLEMPEQYAALYMRLYLPGMSPSL